MTEANEASLLGAAAAEGGSAPPAAPAAGQGEAKTPAGTAPTGADPQATEGKTAETAKGSAADAKTKTGEDGGEPKGQEPAGPPEQYDLKLADGVQPDAAALEEFSGVARELGLTQDQAQRLVDLQQRLERKGIDAAHAYYRDQTLKHREAVKADAELGGADWEKKVAVANQALNRFGTPELKAFLQEQPWIGSHPEVVRAFYRAGKAISEDTLVTGDNASPKSTWGKVMYGSVDTGAPAKE